MTFVTPFCQQTVFFLPMYITQNLQEGVFWKRSDEHADKLPRLAQQLVKCFYPSEEQTTHRAERRLHRKKTEGGGALAAC